MVDPYIPLWRLELSSTLQKLPEPNYLDTPIINRYTKYTSDL